jgi:hypothetical protein
VEIWERIEAETEVSSRTVTVGDTGTVIGLDAQLYRGYNAEEAAVSETIT